MAAPISLANSPTAVKPLPIIDFIFAQMPSAFLRRVDRHVFVARGTRFLAWTELGLFYVKDTITGGYTGGMTAEECDSVIAALYGTQETPMNADLRCEGCHEQRHRLAAYHCGKCGAILCRSCSIVGADHRRYCFYDRDGQWVDHSPDESPSVPPLSATERHQQQMVKATGVKTGNPRDAWRAAYQTWATTLRKAG